MAIALFNPKVFEVGGKRVANTADIKRFVWSHAYWDLKVGELKKFPDEVGEALLRQCEFLVEVTPKNIKEVKNQMAEKKFQCKHCAFSTDTKIAYLTHVRTQHGATEEQEKEFAELEEAQPKGGFRGSTGSATPITPEESEGIPSTTGGNVTDKDGVEWYGDGTTDDKLT